MDPYADYGAKILVDGFAMSGDTRSGMKVTVKYLVPNSNAYTFLNAIVNPVNQVTIGTVTYSLPYQLPATISATPIFAQSFDVKHVGVRRDLATGPATYGGLAAGEFFSHSVVTIGFEQLAYSTDAAGQDPNGLNQLDPDNPITWCEQSVKINAKMETRKGINYQYASDSTPVVGDAAVRVLEARLVLKFPRVPYLPWRLISPYIGKVNSNTVLTAPAESLLLTGTDTVAKQSLGSLVPIEQAVTLEFAYNADGFNKLPRPDGTLAAVVRKGDTSKGIYDKADFRQIFATLNFARSG
jgi:hypothetical protein